MFKNYISEILKRRRKKKLYYRDIVFSTKEKLAINISRVKLLPHLWLLESQVNNLCSSAVYYYFTEFEIMKMRNELNRAISKREKYLLQVERKEAILKRIL
jgi:protein-arginine kinase